MSRRDPTTLIIRRLRSAELAVRESAAADLWRRLMPSLLSFADRRIDRRLARRESAEDVVQSACTSFFIRHARGELNVEDSSQLWNVLLTITSRKICNLARRHSRARRDFRREKVEPADRSSSGPRQQLESIAPPPAEAAALQEALAARLDALPENLRQIAVWKLEGYTNEEIAALDKLDCAVRTVERKLARIRQLWQADSSNFEFGGRGSKDETACLREAGTVSRGIVP